jgi:hypothetical protein
MEWAAGIRGSKLSSSLGFEAPREILQPGYGGGKAF